MIESRILTRAAIVLSVIGHVAFVAWVLLFAGAHPLDGPPPSAITVDIVTPDMAPPEAKDIPKDTPKDSPETKDTTETRDTAQQPPEPPQDAAKPAEPPQMPAAAAAPSPAPDQNPFRNPAAAEAAPAPMPSQAPPVPPSGPPVVEADITERYGMMFTLPDGGYDPAARPADISTDAAKLLRARLKTCSPLPKSLDPEDKVRIRLRVAFRRDGMLAMTPALIEASASEKGPALMKAAIGALRACQPYDMLPADKYDEWKVLDLDFTTKDFRS